MLYLYYFLRQKSVNLLKRQKKKRNEYMEVKNILSSLLTNNSIMNQQMMNYIIMGLLVFIIILLGITMFTKKN